MAVSPSDSWSSKSVASMMETVKEEPDEVEGSDSVGAPPQGSLSPLEISELRRARERNLHLDQEILALSSRIRSLDLSLFPTSQTIAKLRKVQQELLDSSEACSFLTSEGDLSDQKTEELQLELFGHSQAVKEQSCLQEKLAQEGARLAEAEEKIVELQQKLKESHHQLQLCEMHILQRKQLEEEVKELREKYMKAQREFQEEQWERKLLDQQVEELQQHLRLQQDKEAQLVRTCAELQVRAQQQEARLRVLEEEKKTLSNEHLHCQTQSQRLLEQIVALQQEKEVLFKELVHILKRVDTAVRKHHERKLRHKAKLRRAKEILISELKQRDVCIRQLENKLQLSKNQTAKGVGLDDSCDLFQLCDSMTQQMSTANGELMQERTKLLDQLHQLQEAERSNKQSLSTIQSRVEFLDEENQQHHERSLQLAAQVGDLKRALQKINGPNLDELKGIGFPECQLQSKFLPLPDARFLVANPSDPLQVIQDGKGEAGAIGAAFQSLETGYVDFFRDSADIRKEQPSKNFASGCF